MAYIQADSRFYAKPRRKRRYNSAIAEFTMIRPWTNGIFHVILFCMAVSCVLPVLLVISISFSDEVSILQYGYRFIPKTFSLEGYRFVFMQGAMILQALKMSLLVTILGTALAIILTTSMGYVLSRKEFKLHKIYTWLIVIPMFVGGGMVASYFINTRFLHLGNTMWILILPAAVGPFNCIICRTFFRTNVPEGIVDSAKIDGAGHMTIFFKLVLPVSLPLIATMGLFASFGYWGDWFTALLYIDDMELYTLQALLQRLLNQIELLTKNLDVVGVEALELLLRLPKEGARMAILVLIVMPIACAYPFFQRYFVSGLTIGSIKE